MSDKSIRIGIVGAGANTRAKHIPLLQKIPGVDIVQVCNRSEASSRKVADEFGIPSIAAHWKELVANPEIDAVVIGTWPYLHAPITLAALDAGKHVLCEARMAMNAEEARRMLAASRAHPELVSMVVPSPFTLKVDKTIKRLLDEDAIGQLLHVDVFACGSFFNPDRPMTWRDDRELSGLNTMGMGIAYEAMVRWTGHVKLPVQAQARIHGKQRVDSEGTLRDVRVPDHLNILGEFETGATLYMRVSQVTGVRPGPAGFVLYGENATLRLNEESTTLTLHYPDGREEAVEIPEEEAGEWRVEEEFINAICGREPVTRTPFDEGLRYMEFTESAARAAGYA